MPRPTCPICQSPSLCDVPNLALKFMCPVCSADRSAHCECGMVLRQYTGAGPVDGWLCARCDFEHAEELEVVCE
jgi:hypothetical protein